MKERRLPRQNLCAFSVAVLFGVAVLAPLFLVAAETAAQPIQIPATVDCSALSVTPETSPKINHQILFTRSGRKLSAVRGTTERLGQESFHGTIEPYGLVKISGMGRFIDGSSSWTFTFASARPDASGGAVFTGNLRDRFGNTRTCIMTVASGLQR